MGNFYKNWDDLSITYDRYITQSKNVLLKDFIKREKRSLFSLIDESLKKKEVIVVEIGSGTGRLLFEIAEDQSKKENPYQIRFLIGIDVSPIMTKIAKKKHQDFLGKNELSESWENKIKFCCENAILLNESIKQKDLNFNDATIIVVCVLNTLGIIDPNERSEVIRQMIKLAGIEGKIFISVFNAESFQKNAFAIYKPITKMIGPIDEKQFFDKNSPDVKSKTGYYSHWFKESEIINLITDSLKNTNYIPKQLTHIKVKDIGIIFQIL